MTIKYHLLKSHLTSSNNKYLAKVEEGNSYDLVAIVEKMAEEGSTLTKSDILAALNSFFETVTKITKEGGIINLDLFKSSFSIQGVFDDITKGFNPKEHEIKLNLVAGEILKELLPKMHVEKTATMDNLPTIEQVEDLKTKSIDDQISTDGVVYLYGNNIKVSGENANNGIFLIDAANNNKTKIDTLIENEPSKIIFRAPANLAKGKYTLEITTQYAKSGNLKDPRTGIFQKTLNVV